MLTTLFLVLSAPIGAEDQPPMARVARASTGAARTDVGRRRAEPRTVAEAERALSAEAQRIGQWAALRKWAAADAVMFVPEPVGAQAWLKGRAEPAGAIAWVPAEVYLSCDGRMAATTGPSRRSDGTDGYVSTVWVKQPGGGWRWIIDHGDEASISGLDPSRHLFDPKLKPAVIRASCKRGQRWGVPPGGLFAADADDHDGSSPDASLLWFWSVSKSGAREVRVALWNGHAWENAIWDRVGFPYQRAEVASRQ